MVDKARNLRYNITCVYGMWHSLVARFVRDEEAAGSNPVIPTRKYTDVCGRPFFVV